ncbi:SDR family NAD(P)-dependent oxidoreductase [soil metagenome]
MNKRAVLATYDFTGRTAIVTGGAKGIGHVVAEKLVDAGASVHVWDLNPARLETVTSTLVDGSDRAAVNIAVASLLAQKERVDILVNNAGYLGGVQSFADHPTHDWARIVATNLLGMMNVAQALLPHFIARGAGRIINMGSLAGKEGLAGLAAYSAASGGVVAFTKALGRELAATGVRVNCVAPGPIDTDMIRDLGTPAVLGMIADSPMKRLGRVEEVAELVLWLCSDASDFNTGAVFDMSGGRARY